MRGLLMAFLAVNLVEGGFFRARGDSGMRGRSTKTAAKTTTKTV